MNYISGSFGPKVKKNLFFFLELTDIFTLDNEGSNFVCEWTLIRSKETKA